MKKFPVLLLAGALLIPAALAAATFEGKVTMKMTGPKGSPPLVNFSLKEGFSRIDVEAGQGQSVAMIMDQSKQEMIIMMAAQKMYLVRPLPKPGDIPAAQGAAPHDMTVERTSVTETILGYECVKIVATDKGTTTEMWVTDQLGTFMGMGGGGPMGGRRGGPGGPAGEAWEQALRGKASFPLRVVTTKDGKEAFRMEATSVEKMSLPDSVFAPPADFQKLDMGNMMRGMMPGGMPPGGPPPGGG
jgi:Domain of unknown function (DUF4412)